MKMTQEHYSTLKGAVVASLEPMGVPKEVLENHLKQYESAGLTPRRAHFDLFWHANRTQRDTVKKVMDAFYQYGNDDHLATALKAIVKEIAA